MKEAGRIAAMTLEEVGRHIAPGIRTKELDAIADRFVKRQGAKAVFVGYRGYPATICVSINDEVVHGIPGSRVIQEGDIVSIDFAAEVGGFVGDTAKTWPVGSVPKETADLIDATQTCLDIGIKSMKSGNRVGDIGAAIQDFAESKGYGVVRDFVGHGIGRRMHEDPAVPNFGKPGTGIRLEPGLVLAIEPMITMGTWQVKVLEDGWTVVTQDGKLSSHFEHTIAVTENGPEVLTTL